MKAVRHFSGGPLGLIVLAALAALGAAGVAQAQTSTSVFTVADVPVDATAATAIAARELARIDGQRRAFGILLGRLTLAADLGRLPRLPDAKLTDIVRDFEVANERSSAVRYLADYTFRFRPEPVRRLLHDAGIPFAETVSKPVTVLPVLIRGDSRLLWDDPNPWREAWANRKASGGLVPLAVPLGEAADVAAIGPEQAIAADPDALAAISAHYGGGDVLIAQATMSDAGQLETVVRRVSGGTATQISSAAYRPNPGESEADMLARAVTASDAALEEAWKHEMLLGFGTEGVLTAEVPIGEITDWLFVRDRLTGVAAVKRSDLVEIGKRAARVEIHYAGDPKRLQLALAQRDLVLSGAGTSWTLQRRGAAPQ